MFDEINFKALVGHYASGITIIGTVVDDKPTGFTCQSFHSVSVHPPLVSFNVMRSSTSWPAVRDVGKFSINVLSEKQQSTSSALAKSGSDKWDKVSWDTTPRGNLLLEDALIWLDCELFAEHDAGDHTLVLARVVDMRKLETIPDASPLLYYRGRYCSLVTKAQVSG